MNNTYIRNFCLGLGSTSSKYLGARYFASCNTKHQLRLKVETILKQKKDYEQWVSNSTVVDGNRIQNQETMVKVIEYLENNVPQTTLYAVDYDDYLGQRFKINAANRHLCDEDSLNLSQSFLRLLLSTPTYMDGNPTGNGVCGWFLSKFLTYPLTMSYGLKQISSILKKSKKENQDNSDDMVVNSLVIGARAECWMKPSAWNECIYTLGNALCSGATKINVTLTGPGLIHYAPPIEGNEPLWFGSCIKLAPYDPKLHCFLHEYKESSLENRKNNDVVTLLSKQDVLFMFNPGVGYNASITESMRTQSINTWVPTMKLLLKSFKPIVVTSLNVSDYTRDLELWYKVCDELNYNIESVETFGKRYALKLIIKPPHSDEKGFIRVNHSAGINHTNNPFKSYAYEIDPHDVVDPIVMPNCIIYGIQLIAL